jgi:hypothetical protein
VLALTAATGEPVGVYAAAGAPAALALGAAPGGSGRCLYLVDAVPGPERDDGEHPNATARRWDLVRLDPSTLAVEHAAGLSEPPLWFSVAPGGERAYAISGGDSSVGGTELLQIDLTSGSASTLTTLPSRGRGLAVTGERLYAVDSAGGRLWVVAGRDGRIVQTIAVGRRPVSIAIGGASRGN